jgi:hypothetical protein
MRRPRLRLRTAARLTAVGALAAYYLDPACGQERRLLLRRRWADLVGAIGRLRASASPAEGDAPSTTLHVLIPVEDGQPAVDTTPR